MTIAALFVRRKNHYAALGCDCYDINRDALTWAGGQPGVFHPPCRSWSQLSHFAKPRPGERELAIWSMDMVRKFGGVVEHPYNSRLWRESACLGFGIRDQFGGVLVPVQQNWFGHRAQKKTSLYIVGPVPDLANLEHVRAGENVPVENMGRPERERTTPHFAAFLVNLAKSCEVVS